MTDIENDINYRNFNLGNFFQDNFVSDEKKMQKESALRDAAQAREQNEAMMKFMTQKAISSGSSGANSPNVLFIAGGIAILGIFSAIFILKK